MIQFVEAINEVYNIDKIHGTNVFLAGGITNCPDWQAVLIDMIKDYKRITEDVVVYNPRRKNFPIGDPNAAEQQITWEYEHLKNADIIIFWFSVGSLNPIVLYELGRWGNSSDKMIIVGIDPKYERKQDVEIQTKLSKPHTPIVYSLEEVAESLYGWLC
jgi:hypothetical protein